MPWFDNTFTDLIISFIQLVFVTFHLFHLPLMYNLLEVQKTKFGFLFFWRGGNKGVEQSDTSSNCFALCLPCISCNTNEFVIVKK